MATVPEWVMDKSGCTERELDHWARSGYLGADVESCGTGVRRKWGDEPIRLARRIAVLRDAGLTLPAAAYVANASEHPVVVRSVGVVATYDLLGGDGPAAEPSEPSGLSHQDDVAAWHLERWGRPPDPARTALKLVSEVGELADAVLAAIDSDPNGTGKGVVVDELGDAYTMVVCLAAAFGLDAEQCARDKFARSRRKHPA